MKKYLLTIVMMLIANVMYAQHEAIEVVPGSDGELPVTNISKTPTASEGTFSGLWMQSLYYHHHSSFVVNGNWMNLDAYEAELYFPNPDSEFLGGSYYTLEANTGGAWSTILSDSGGEAQYSSGATVEITENTKFRLVLHGGPKDGWVSNTLTVNYPAVNYSVMIRGGWSEPNFVDVGFEQSGCFVEMEHQDRGVYDPDKDPSKIIYTTYARYDNTSSCYVRQWYRQNPYTFERTKIEGATTDSYVPTAEDVGYELVDVVQGDDSSISFYYEHNHGKVQVPIVCYPEYMGSDGFVLNTNYALPNGGKDIVAIDWMSEDSQSFPQDKIVERKPGQYVFATPCTDESGFMVEYANENNGGDYHMAMLMGEPDGYTWYHLAALFFGEKRPMKVTSKQSVPVDVICQNTSGDWISVATVEPGSDEPIYLNLGRYYLKSQATANTLPTYYPNVLLWGEAESVKPGASYDEDWNEIPNTYAIDVQAMPAPLAGQGSIEGTIDMAGSASRNRAASNLECIVYLKQKGGDIVAMEKADGGGAYSFAQVPYGNYSVLVNIDGYTQDQATEIALSAEQPKFTGVDYKLEGNNIIALGYTGIVSILRQDSDSSIFSIDGRKGQSKGVNIIRLSNGKTMKVVK